MTERAYRRNMRERMALRERMILGRELRGMSRRRLAVAARCSEGLVRLIEEDWTSVTHPAIAARLLAECGIRDARCLRLLTNMGRWKDLPEELPPQRAAEPEPETMPEPATRAITSTPKPEIVKINWSTVNALIQLQGKTRREMGVLIGHGHSYLWERQTHGGMMPLKEARRLARELGVVEEVIME